MEDSSVVFKKRLRLVIVLVVILLVVWGGFAIYRAATFRIVHTNPNTKKMTIVSPFFDVAFDRDLSSKVTVSSNPDIIHSYTTQNKELNISLKVPLNPKQTYTISISNIYSTSGKRMKNQKFVFTPKSVDLNDLPKDQGQALLNNQSQYSNAISGNGLLQLLPFTEPNFEYSINYTVNYSSQVATPVIQITAPDQPSQQAALDWIKAQGYDPSRLDIQYITAQPQ